MPSSRTPPLPPARTSFRTTDFWRSCCFPNATTVTGEVWCGESRERGFLAKSGWQTSISMPTPISIPRPLEPSPPATGSAKGQPLCLIGDSGTGKSHLLIGLGAAAAEHGYRVKYVLATRLVNELVEAADEKQLARTIARYGRVDLLLLDELGYMELDKRGAELLFQVLTEREEKNSVAIASNESFSKAHMFARICA